MKKIIFLAVVVLAVFLAMEVATIAVADCDITKEPANICLYDEYVFPKDSLNNGIVSLSFLIPGKVMKEKGLEGVWREVAEKVLSRYLAKDRQEGISSYLVSIISFPYEDIPAVIVEEEFNRLFLELLMAIRGQDV